MKNIKVYLIFILSFILSLRIDAQVVVPVEENLPVQVKLGSPDKEPLIELNSLNGEAKLSNDEGDLLAEGTGLLADKTGPWVYYYGGASHEVTGDNPNRRNSPVWMEGQWKQGVKMGEWKVYDQDGTLREVQHWNLKLKMAEVWLYHSNGQLSATGWVNGANQERDSVWTFYDTDGKVTHHEKYHKLVSENHPYTYNVLDTCYGNHPDGNLAYKGNRGGMTYYLYHENGGLREELSLDIIGVYNRGRYNFDSRSLEAMEPDDFHHRIPEEVYLPVFGTHCMIRQRRIFDPDGKLVLVERFGILGKRHGIQEVLNGADQIVVEADFEDKQAIVTEYSEVGSKRSVLKFVRQGNHWKLSYALFYDNDGNELRFDPYGQKQDKELLKLKAECKAWELGWDFHQ